MVKVQKPSPKTLQQDSTKKIKNIQIKKAKTNQTNDAKPKQSSIAISKNDKTKLVKTTVKSLPTKNVSKKKANKDDKNPLQKDGDVPKGKQIANVKLLIVGQPEIAEAPKKQLKQQKPKPIVTEPPLDKAQKRKASIKAFNNSQKKKRGDGVEKKPKSSSSKHQFETVPFDEEKFKTIVNLTNIKKISEALKGLVEKEVNEKKTSIFSDYRYFLNVSSYKIPNCPKRMVKLNLKHSLVDVNSDDIVIIVPDLQRGAKVDYEPTIQHYEDLFRDIGVTNLKIVPFNQLRNECTTFESKRKFANTYDYFLCDGRIVSHVVGFCGKHFQKPRSTFHAVRLDNPKTYKSDIEHALKRTAYKQLEKGDLISIPVANHRFNVSQLAENVEFVIDQLKNIFPGGYANVRNIHMKIDIKGTSSMPLYVNLAGAPSETPNVMGLREQRMLKLKKEANDILSKFSLSKTGDFVKLNKGQVQRKQQIREASESLSKDTIEASNDNEEVVPPTSKKVKKEDKKESDVKEDIEQDVDENDLESPEEDSEDEGDEEELSDNVEENSDNVDEDDSVEEDD